ncbi:hypothetical protein DFH09DRAFT_1373603 [Mycena vulgaris]|nr:hypothetical protein DFH09DRAFT_1373603 [Mycena vulgaris]
MSCWFPARKRVTAIAINVLLPPLAFPELVEDAGREINSLTVDFVDIKENSRSRAKGSNKTSRRAPLQDRNAGSSAPASADDNTRIRELEALLREAQNQLRTTEARLRDAGDAQQHPTT